MAEDLVVRQVRVGSPCRCKKCTGIIRVGDEYIQAIRYEDSLKRTNRFHESCFNELYAKRIEKEEKRTSEIIPFYTKMVDFINSNEFFWMKDLKIHLEMEVGIENYNNEKSRWLNRAIQDIKKAQIVQCCGMKGAERQYMRLRRIVGITDIIKK